MCCCCNTCLAMDPHARKKSVSASKYFLSNSSLVRCGREKPVRKNFAPIVCCIVGNALLAQSTRASQRAHHPPPPLPMLLSLARAICFYLLTCFLAPALVRMNLSSARAFTVRMNFSTPKDTPHAFNVPSCFIGGKHAL